MPKPIHDSEMRSEEQGLTQALQDEWHDTLLPLLPEQLEQQAKQLKAFERAKGLRRSADLLRGILAYAFCLSSFRQVGSWAASRGISTNGERSWAKLTRQVRLWLLWILQQRLRNQEPDPALCRQTSVRVLVVDASPADGWRQTDQCRLHVSYHLQAQRIAQIVLTDQRGGERLTAFSFEQGDILVADRGDFRRQAIWDVLQAGWHILVRALAQSAKARTRTALPSIYAAGLGRSRTTPLNTSTGCRSAPSVSPCVCCPSPQS